jgi:hypothetical protein
MMRPSCAHRESYASFAASAVKTQAYRSSRKSVCVTVHRCPTPVPRGRPERALTAEGPVYCHGQLILRLIDERKGVEEAGGAQEEAA